jgi:glycosyltransferase involved in cell wall biosynthesis
VHIGIIAPLTESIPPKLYGGTERVVSVLTEELVRRGHEVTLFASGDSETSANLVPCCPQGLRLAGVANYTAHAVSQLGEAYKRAGEFDVIHNHVDYLAFPFARFTPTPTVTTTHGRLDLPEVRQLYRTFEEQPLISISDDQRSALNGANWVATVYNAIEVSNYHFRSEPGDYLVFLGRISPEKRPDRAIEIARETGMRLMIGAKVDPADEAYYEHAIKPLIRDCPLVEYVGELNEREKDELLGGAYAYLFPIDWPEPFGLTMAEAMATGTPVIALRRGSVDEVIVDGVTGFVCDSVCEMISAVARVGSIDRRACRQRVESHFSPHVMATRYERAYSTLLSWEVGSRVSPLIKSDGLDVLIAQEP